MFRVRARFSIRAYLWAGVPREAPQVEGVEVAQEFTDPAELEVGPRHALIHVPTIEPPRG